jgi:hypothetical protein
MGNIKWAFRRRGAEEDIKGRRGAMLVLKEVFEQGGKQAKN